jgi:hypothetical protein
MRKVTRPVCSGLGSGSGRSSGKAACAKRRKKLRGPGIAWMFRRWRKAKRRTYERQGIEELQGHPRLGIDRAARDPRSRRDPRD